MLVHFPSENKRDFMKLAKEFQTTDSGLLISYIKSGSRVPYAAASGGIYCLLIVLAATIINLSKQSGMPREDIIAEVNKMLYDAEHAAKDGGTGSE